MKKLFIVSAVALAVITGCAQQQTVSQGTVVEQQQAAAIIVSPNDQRQYKTFTLPNKLEVVLVSDPSTEKSAVSLSVGAGMFQDPMTQQGLAHYLEHMLFMGTERYPDPAEYAGFMSQHNGAYNAYTWLDITNYMFEINNSKYEEALDRFADFFKAPLLLPEYVDKERNAVNSEWSLNRNQDGWAQRQIAAQLLGEHPANKFWIGNLDTLSDKTDSKLHEELVAFYQQYYSANRMKLVLISPQPLPQMQLLAQRYFAGIKNKKLQTHIWLLQKSIL